MLLIPMADQGHKVERCQHAQHVRRRHHEASPSERGELADCHANAACRLCYLLLRFRFRCGPKRIYDGAPGVATGAPLKVEGVRQAGGIAPRAM